MDVIQVCASPLTVLVVVGDRRFYVVGEENVQELQGKLTSVLVENDQRQGRFWRALSRQSRRVDRMIAA